ncbi:bifunctional adenosylcobinamide kinase/adenosylcobinamide-phosphate guanylyltransferase [Uliginosibacterium sp. sgz301328]|uniref:bifunctional adenosylcobinamide kinase/adenosylcobinamide-phosphate guanylyltransferase n=1 Tax=Uliginosibacterium sp. sgz301328 TaxID=3243764 RepID=UPI00359EA31E
MSRHLVLGGARSGKSRYAQDMAARASDVSMIVTAEAWDDEMRARIALHRQSRPAHWQTVEAPLALAAAIDATCRPNACVLIDCMTLWLSNVMCGVPDTLEHACDVLVDAVARAPGELIIVANEVGWGIVPENALARQFRDEAGRLNQRLAAVCDTVTLVVAGLPMPLKHNGAVR